MGASSRQALASAVTALEAAKGVTLATGEQLMTAGRAVEESAQLRTILGDPAIAASEKSALVAKIFPGLEKTAAQLLGGIVESRWSSGAELVAGIEEVGIRAIAQGDGHTKAIEAELFAFARIVASDPELDGVFIASGYGIKPGKKLGKIRNRDVAPTIAELLGLSLPNAEGHALKEALAP